MAWTSSFSWAQDLASFYTGTAIPNAPKHTGRLPLSNEEVTLSIPKVVLFAPEPYLVPEAIKEKIHFRHGATDLNEMFFSQGNIDLIHQLIQSTVRQMVGGEIDRQSDPELMMVMRSYYLQYAQNSPENAQAELQSLNERVVNFCANRIAVEVEAYRYYRKDILDFPEPIARPVVTNVYGTRTGELKSFF